MDKLQVFFDLIDWVLCGVLIIAGRYWGRKYFKPFKLPRYNFLAFATLAGIVYVVLGIFDGVDFTGRATSLMVTFIFATSFYEWLASRLFSKIEALIPSLGKAAGTIDGGDEPPPEDGGGSTPGGGGSTPPPGTDPKPKP